MKTEITIKGIPKLMKTLRGYEQVAMRVMGKILYQEGETVMAQSKQLVPTPYCSQLSGNEAEARRPTRQRSGSRSSSTSEGQL